MRQRQAQPSGALVPFPPVRPARREQRRKVERHTRRSATQPASPLRRPSSAAPPSHPSRSRLDDRTRTRSASSRLRCLRGRAASQCATSGTFQTTASPRSPTALKSNVRPPRCSCLLYSPSRAARPRLLVVCPSSPPLLTPCLPALWPGTTKGGRTYLCYASSQKEEDAWLTALSQVVYASRGGGMFGTDITTQLQREVRARAAPPPLC